MKSFFSVLLRKRFWFIILLAFAFFMWKFGRPVILFMGFNISGTVSIEKNSKLSKKTNTILHIVAKNENGIPIAGKKIYNPKFPQPYTLNFENIFYKDLITKNYTLDFYFNDHGEIGSSGHGDMFAVRKDTVPFWGKGINVTLRTKN